MVRGDEILRSESRIGGRNQARGGDNTKLLIGALAGFMVLLVGFGAFGFKVMSDRQTEQVRALIERQNELAKLATENLAKAEVEVEARGAAAEDARKAQEEAESRVKAEEAARLAALEAVRKAEEAKRGDEAEAQRRKADEAAKREAEARSRVDDERKRRDSELLAQRRAEEIAAREKSAAAAAAKKARELEDKQAREAREADRKAILEEQKARREEERAKKEEAAQAAEERRRAQEEAKREAEAKKKEEAAAAAAAVVAEGGTCPKGMMLIKEGNFMMGAPMNDPDRNFGDLPYASKTLAAYCIDYYEAPNSRGKMPSTKVSYKSAEKSCKGRSKRLCSEEEWEKACKGPSGSRFPYGNQWNPENCNTEDEEGNDREVAASGTFAKCRGAYNVLDLSGNVAEWTSTEWSSGSYVIKGGSADRPSYDARCASRKKKAAGAADAMLGYRCCADPK